jgi:hypothetical protein
MTSLDDQAAAAAKRVYARAAAGGASIHVAFDLACNAYCSCDPSLKGITLRRAVAQGAGLSREDVIKIEIGLYA